MDQQNEALEHGNVKQLLWQYALPAIIATTATSFYNIIDRIFIGRAWGLWPFRDWHSPFLS